MKSRERSCTPVKYVDVVRQTRTHIDHVSEDVINDIGTEAKDVNLSEVWPVTTRFQILRTRLAIGYNRVDGGPPKILKTSRPDSVWPDARAQISKKKRKTSLQNGQKKVPRCNQRATTGESTKFRTMTRIISW